MSGEVSLAWVLPLPELVWWIGVQSVYARSIGCSFAKAANDNGGGGFK
jgi:hypothetical protein